MKKVLFAIAITAFAACGSNSSSETKATDTTVVKTDSAMKTDTSMKKTDTVVQKKDTVTKK